MPLVSPKRSPAPPAPPSPAGSLTFSFPSRAPPAPDPQAHKPPLTPHPVSCGTPPPLPPRRRRDSAAPPTPIHLTSSSVPASQGASPSAGAGGGTPPPLPPRPAPAPALLRPAHSAILQRRQHTNTTNGGAPRLPPKPPPVSPRP